MGEDIRLSEVLEMIDAIVARPDLHDAVAEVTGTVPPPDADDDGGWRQEMATHFPTVSGLVKTLTSAIEFDANTEGQPALTAMRSLPAALAYRSHYHSVTLLPRRLIDTSVVRGVWKRLVFRPVLKALPREPLRLVAHQHPEPSRQHVFKDRVELDRLACGVPEVGLRL